MDPEVLLFTAGYTRYANGSFVRQFDEEHRFHAYIIGPRTIELHTDLSKLHTRKGYTYHVASVFKCKEERRRMMDFIPLPEPGVKMNRKQLGFEDEILARDTMLDVLKNL